MIYKCTKCGKTWHHPVINCIFCKTDISQTEPENLKVIGITEVFIPSVEHPDVPYYALLLEDENCNHFIEKSFERYNLGDNFISKKEGGRKKATIGVIGTGAMGLGVAQIGLESGFKVILTSRSDASLEKALAKIRNYFSKTLNEKEFDLLQKNIKLTTELSDIKDSDIVVECIVEDIDVKKQLFKKLSVICSAKTILTSNTSSLSISEIASIAKKPERVAGMHFFNPVPKMRLVEVVRGEKTSDATINQLIEIVKQLKKAPVVTKDSPCFIVNRILMPYLNEAAYVLDEHVASAEDIDTAVKLGLNHPMGPLELLDLIGLDLFVKIMENMYQRTGNPKYLPSPIVKKMVDEGKLGHKTNSGFRI